MAGFKCVVCLSVVIVAFGVCGEASNLERISNPAETSRADLGQLPVFLPEPLRMIAEKTAKGEEIKPEDLPQELRELIADIEAVCELDRQLHQQMDATRAPTRTSTRTGKGLLASLAWLTNSPLAFYTGSGTLSSQQSLTILGRIINSALRLDYGPVRSQGATTMAPAN